MSSSRVNHPKVGNYKDGGPPSDFKPPCSPAGAWVFARRVFLEAVKRKQNFEITPRLVYKGEWGGDNHWRTAAVTHLLEALASDADIAWLEAGEGKFEVS